MKKQKKGFSFIELIVVVTIIAVLSVAGVVTYSAVNRKSRDSRRISDLEKMRMALEMIRQVGVTYPSASSVLAPTYLQAIPKDPVSGNNYIYAQTNSGYGYTINAILEDPSSSGTGSTAYQVSNP